MDKILLFYKYIDIQCPKRVMKWQKKICQDLGLTGRILLGHEGINGTISGNKQNTKHYKRIMNEHNLFGNIDFKESNGSTDCFPRMQVKVKNEIVRLGIDPQKITPKQGGIHLTTKKTHELIKQNPDDLLILDTRNNFEWKIGHFKGAIKPDIDHFRDLPKYIDNNLEQFKDKNVLMYCTGGIRCERATAYLKSKNIAKEVYQIEGGIHRYVDSYPDGYFRGKNYVFDNRIAIKVNDDVLGTCEICNISCDEYINCLNATCNKHFVCCKKCLATYENTCGATCLELVKQRKVNTRPQFEKYEHKQKHT